MKYLLTLFLSFVILAYDANSQFIQTLKVDTASFPTIKAKIYAFDANGKQNRSLTPSDFAITENGISRSIINFSTPSENSIKPLSLTFGFDVSASMNNSDFGISPLALSKITATKLCNSIENSQSDFAIQSCDSKAAIIQDFSNDKNKILAKINLIQAIGRTNYDQIFLNSYTGLLNISKTGKNKRIAILFTDAMWQDYAPFGSPVNECLRICQDSNIQLYVVIYGRLGAEPNGISKSLKKIAHDSKGQLFDGIITKKDAENVAYKIRALIQEESPNEISWQSEIHCEEAITNVNLKIISQNISDTLSYTNPYKSISGIAPFYGNNTVVFKNPIPNVSMDKKLKILAKGVNYTVTDILVSNPNYSISPKSFSLNPKQEIELTISYLPTDTTYTYCEFDLIDNNCLSKLYARSNTGTIAPLINTLKITQPKGGEQFQVGNNVIIKWEGVTPIDTVTIEYSSDNGVNWHTITNSAVGLKFIWENIPLSIGTNCLLRIRQNADFLASKYFEWTQIRIDAKAIEWSPDSKILAFTNPIAHTVELVDPVTFEPIGTLLGSKTDINSIAWSPNGKQIATGDQWGGLIIWDVKSRSPLQTLTSRNTSAIKDIDWSPDGTKISVTNGGSEIYLWDIQNGVIVDTLMDGEYYVASLDWSPDGKYIASGTSDKSVIIWNAKTGKIERTLTKFDKEISKIKWSPNGKKLAIKCTNKINIWDTKTNNTTEILVPEIYFTAQVLCWSPDGTQILTCVESNVLKIINIDSGKVAKSDTILYALLVVNWSPDGKKIAIGLQENIVVWDITSDIQLRYQPGHTNYVNSVDWSSDGKYIVSAGDNETIIWDAKTHKLLNKFNRRSQCVKWSPDCTKIAIAEYNRTITIWDVANNAEIYNLTGHFADINRLNWSPDGSKIASAGKDSTVIIWDANEGIPIITLQDDMEEAIGVSWSPDSKKLISISLDKIARIWDTNSWKILYSIPYKDAYNVIWHPDGNQILCSNTKKFWFIDPNIGVITKEFDFSNYEYTNQYLDGLSISPNGSMFSTGISVWDIANGSMINKLTMVGSSIYEVCWSPDGKHIAIASSDKFLSICNYEPKYLQTVNLDNTISIISPELKLATDIDMGKAIKSQNRDSLITDFMFNPGTVDCKIKKICFYGTDAGDFSIISGIPKFDIVSGGRKSIKVRFKPDTLGVKMAKMLVVTTAGEFELNIKGECVPYNFSFSGVGTYLGKLIEGESKDSIINTVINYDSTEFVVSDVVKIGPNTKDFELIDFNPPYKLSKSDTLKLHVKFTGSEIGRTCCRLSFLCPGQVLPLEQMLYAEVVDKAGNSVEDNYSNSQPMNIIYPNPAKDKINITAKIIENGTKIRLLDLAGKVIKEINCEVTEAKTQDFSIDLSVIMSGIYFIEFKSANFSQVEKLVVDK